MSDTPEKIPVFWVWGNYYDCKRYWFNNVCKPVKKACGNYSIEIFDCGYKKQGPASITSMADTSDVIMALKNRDMYQEYPRIIKLKGLSEDYAFLTDYLDLVDNNNILFIDSPPGYRQKPPSTQFVSIKNSKLYKIVKEFGYMTEYPLEAKNFDHAANWIRGILNKLNKNITEEALRKLVDNQGRNLDNLYSYVTSLIDYCYDKDIELPDVDMCVPALMQKTVWEYLESLDILDYESSIEKMYYLLDSAEHVSPSGFNAGIHMIFGAIKIHFLFLLLVKYHSECFDYLEAKKAVDGMKKKSTEGGITNWDSDRFSPYFVKSMIERPEVREALQMHPGKFCQIWKNLQHCIFSCRLGKYSPDIVRLNLAIFTMTVCEKISPQKSAYLYSA